MNYGWILYLPLGAYFVKLYLKTEELWCLFILPLGVLSYFGTTKFFHSLSRNFQIFVGALAFLLGIFILGLLVKNVSDGKTEYLRQRRAERRKKYEEKTPLKRDLREPKFKIRTNPLPKVIRAAKTSKRPSEGK